MAVRWHDSIKFMKQIIRDWLFGLLVSYYFMLALLCMIAGFSLVIGVDYILEISGCNVPYYILVSISILYVILFCPYFLASYVRYFGLIPRKKEQTL
jgi:hypothetical protein